jgi:uncharacterized PurR-regulated membrane protein YhhQ (DUF165 family)
MKKAVLTILALICITILIISFFIDGPIRIFGVPVSAGIFAIILRFAIEAIEK